MNDLTHTFTVDATPQEAYEAIIDVRSWWGATNIVGDTDQLGADWFYLVPDLADVDLIGVPLAWWLLGIAVYPALLLLGWVYVRRAERNESDFAELLSEAER